jgi:hypothetical protein
MYSQERSILPSVDSSSHSTNLGCYLDSRILDPPRPKLSQYHGHCLGFWLYGTVDATWFETAEPYLQYTLTGSRIIPLGTPITILIIGREGWTGLWASSQALLFWAEQFVPRKEQATYGSSTSILGSSLVG